MGRLSGRQIKRIWNKRRAGSGTVMRNRKHEAKYRHLGKGKEALELLCQQAKENGLRFLCDDIETNNPAKNLFLDLGFKEVWARESITMLKKRL